MTRPAPEQTPKERAAAESSDALARALTDANTTQTDVAEAIGRKRQHVGEMADRKQTRSMNLRDVFLLPEAMQVALLRRIAERFGLLVVTKPKAGATAATIRLALDVQKETSEASTALFEMLIDGIASRPETPKAREELHQARDALDRALAFLDLVDEEGVVALHPAEAER
ncbi:MAG: hypothetical protein JJ863_21490 [Deltaproteobacteria bacterium]|nr:hypothetical protein [Deltaproteobacteria bacterium]